MLTSIALYFAKNIRLLFLIILLILSLGAVSLFTMPKSEDPQFELAMTIVEVIAPGMNPTSIESQIVGPIEQELNLVEDIKSIETSIIQGAVTFTVRFLYGTQPDAGFDEVVRAVSRVRTSFPETVRNIIYFKASPANVNVLQLAVSVEDGNWLTTKRYVNRLQEALQGLSDVQKAQVWGLPQLVAEVSIDQNKLIEHKVSVTDVTQALSFRADNRHAGYLDDAQTRFTLTLSGQYQSFEELKNTQIKIVDEQSISLGDIAEVNVKVFKENYLAFLDEKQVVYVTAQQRKGANIFEFGKQARDVIAEFSENYPDLSIVTTFEQEKSVDTRVTGFMGDLLSGLVLILLCLLFFMGFKQSVWVSLALPLTIFFTLFVLNSGGFILQQMSIAGIIVALGLLVDNSLVVVEQYAKCKEQGVSGVKALKSVVSEVGMPLIAGTLTTVLAFVPLLTLQSDTGDFMRAMPVSVSIALLTSLVVALVILPALMAVFGVNTHSKFTLSYLLNGFAERFYKSFLEGCLRYSWLVIIVFIAVTAGGISLLPKVGVSLFPKAEKNIVVVDIVTPQSSSLSQTRAVGLQLSREMRTLPSVTSAMLTVGATNPQIYYNHVTKRGVVNRAQLMLMIDSYDKSKIQSLMDTIRDNYGDYPNAKVNVFEFQQGPVTDRPITIRILGDDLKQVTQRSIELQDFMESQGKVFDVRNDGADAGLSYNIKIDEHKAAAAGLSLAAAETQVRMLIDGQVIGELKDKYGDNYPILVKDSSVDLNGLKGIYLINPNYDAVPLDTIADIRLEKLEAPFFHYQRTRMMKVSADVLPGGNVAVETAKVIEFLDSLNWAGDLSYKVGGEEEARKESFGGLSEIMILVVVSIFVVLFLQFNSFAQPGIIISLLPIAFGGGVYGMYLIGVSFSLMAFIGLISLIGIMVNDAIIVVDGYNRGRRQSLGSLDAMVQSASSRFTPVILTSLTTIVGLLPLTLYGGELWRPMGIVIITGLFFTTLASLIWVPVLTLKVSGNSGQVSQQKASLME